MDQIVNNGVTYSIDLLTRKISWKEKELNHDIEIIRAIRDWDINKAIANYKTRRHNTDLLTAAGIQDVEANVLMEVLPAMSDKVDFTPDDPNAADLTEIDLKKWINLILDKYFGFIAYDPDNNYELITP